MRLAITSGALLLALLAAPTPSQAQTPYSYPWCSRYDWSTWNCGFRTLQQCLANIYGIGGRCEPNPHYRGYYEPRRKSRRPRR